MNMMSVTEFARKCNMSPQRVRTLIREQRVFPYQQLENGRYILLPNTVIVPPYERPGRKLRSQV